MTLAKGHAICMSTFTKDFSSGTTVSVSFTFHVQLSNKGGGEEKFIYLVQVT